MFDFGGRETRAFGGGEDVPIPFFSRSIGISGGSAVPILGGARLHGRAGAYQMGLLNIQTGDVPGLDVESTNFSAFRVKRDLFSRSNVGVIATHRNVGADGSGVQLPLRRGRELRAERERPHQHLLHGDQRPRGPTAATAPPATWASSTTTPT